MIAQGQGQGQGQISEMLMPIMQILGMFLGPQQQPTTVGDVGSPDTVYKGDVTNHSLIGGQGASTRTGTPDRAQFNTDMTNYLNLDKTKLRL